MKDIPGYEGLYAVERDGRVWSYPKKSGSAHKGKWLKHEYFLGYPRYSLCKDGKQRSIFGHRLVASAFIPNVRGVKTVNHKNGDKADNRVENLEWCTQKENTHHAIATGLWSNVVGEKHVSAKLKEVEVVEIRKRYSQGEKQSVLAKEYGVSQMAVCYIVQRKTWKHVL